MRCWGKGKAKAILSGIWRHKSGRILCILLIVLALAGSVLTVYNSYFSCESVAKRTALGLAQGDERNFAKYLCFDYWKFCVSSYDSEEDFFEQCSEQLDEDIESWADYVAYMKETRRDTLEDQFGEYEITAEVEDVEEYSSRKILALATDAIKSNFNTYVEEYYLSRLYDKEEIKEGKVVTVKVRIKGEDDKLSYETDYYMARNGMNWMILCAVEAD